MAKPPPAFSPLEARRWSWARRTDRLKKVVDEIPEAGGTAEWRALDVTRFDDMRAFAGFAEEKFGSVDVLISNAGIMPLSPPRPRAAALP